MSSPTIINCRKANLNKLGYNDLQHWLEDPTHIYIGRNMSFYIKGAIGSKWQNPFPVKKYGREKCLEMYKEYVLANKDLINSLDELEGKTMACFCSPEPCHGDILIKLYEQRKLK